MLIDERIKSSIASCFGQAAEIYDSCSSLQQSIGVRLLGLLKNYQTEFESIVDLGCGTGITTEKVAQQLIWKNFYAVDISKEMLSRASLRLKSKNIRLIEGDFEQIVFANDSLDLVISNMALQWSLNLPATLNAIAATQKKHAIFCFSMPLSGTLCELTKSNHFESNENILNFLKTSNYEIISLELQKYNVYFPNVLDAIRSIKKIGANFLVHSPKNNSSANSLSAWILKMHRNNFYFKLTYRIGFYVVRRK